MNLNVQQATDLCETINTQNKNIKDVDVSMAPPMIFLSGLAQNSTLHLSAQNCSDQNNGAFTGEVSVEMLASIGVKYVIVGHSERRSYYNETNETVAAKVLQTLKHGLTPVVCVGESNEQRFSNLHFDTVEQQLKDVLELKEVNEKEIIIAYEPVWAIGTGLTATSAQAQEMHLYIRQLLREKISESVAQKTRIIYGGSCKPSNAKELFNCPDIDGGLIGGASLKADSFLKIIQS